MGQLSPNQYDVYERIDTVAPVPTDDVNSGFFLGARWLKTSLPRTSYECLDNGLGVADWREVTAAGSGPTASNFSIKEILNTETITIPVRQQMIVIDGITITGTLIIDGELELI